MGSGATLFPEASVKLLETLHHYRGYHSGGAVCRIEVYAAPGHPPLIVATELPENDTPASPTWPSTWRLRSPSGT